MTVRETKLLKIKINNDEADEYSITESQESIGALLVSKSIIREIADLDEIVFYKQTPSSIRFTVNVFSTIEF